MVIIFFVINFVIDFLVVGIVFFIGEKIYNGFIGMDDQKNFLQIVVEKVKKVGKRVGVIISVSVDYVIFVVFYVYQLDWNMYYEIVIDFFKVGFDFYVGVGFLKLIIIYDKKEVLSIFLMFEEVGYIIVCGYNDYKVKVVVVGKMILI